MTKNLIMQRALVEELEKDAASWDWLANLLRKAGAPRAAHAAEQAPDVILETLLKDVGGPKLLPESVTEGIATSLSHHPHMTPVLAAPWVYPTVTTMSAAKAAVVGNTAVDKALGSYRGERGLSPRGEEILKKFREQMSGRDYVVPGTATAEKLLQESGDRRKQLVEKAKTLLKTKKEG